jgi:hypothetical protein
MGKFSAKILWNKRKLEEHSVFLCFGGEMMIRRYDYKKCEHMWEQDLAASPFILLINLDKSKLRWNVVIRL